MQEAAVGVSPGGKLRQLSSLSQVSDIRAIKFPERL